MPYLLKSVGFTFRPTFFNEKGQLENLNLAIFKIPAMVTIRIIVFLKPSDQKLMKPAYPSFGYLHYLTWILVIAGIFAGSIVSATEISFIDDADSEFASNQSLSALSENQFSWSHHALAAEFASVTEEAEAQEETAYDEKYAEDYEKFKQSLESTGISEIELAIDQSVSVYNVGGEELSVPIAKSQIYRAGRESNYHRVSSSSKNLPVNVNCDRGETRLWLCLNLGW